jgi:hypothetical protein
MSTKEEQEWLRKFYEGNFLVKGWNDRVKEILQAVPQEHKEKIHNDLSGLGHKIGREWSKDNAVRRIDNDRLKNWGDTLQTAKNKGYTVLEETVRSIDAEVDKILSA